MFRYRKRESVEVNVWPVVVLVLGMVWLLTSRSRKA